MRRGIRRAEEWSGVPLRWMLRRIGYALGIAALAGVAMALIVVTAHYGGLRTVTVCTVTACTPDESSVGG